MVLDRQAALERLEQDLELYEEICAIFCDDVPRILAELKTTLKVGDLPAATRHAHSIKSSAANIGATNLSEAARSAENALRNGTIDNIPSLLSHIDCEMELVLKELA